MQSLFRQFEQSSGKKTQDALCRNMIRALKLHTSVEEQVFYPYVAAATRSTSARSRRCARPNRRELVFLFQEHLKNGRQSNFYQFDNPEQES